jgi:hypothetical protein
MNDDLSTSVDALRIQAGLSESAHALREANEMARRRLSFDKASSEAAQKAAKAASIAAIAAAIATVVSAVCSLIHVFSSP